MSRAGRSRRRGLRLEQAVQLLDVDGAQEELDELIGILLFGSVARGDADRASDIEETKFDGNRYTFEVLVESTDSAERIGSRLR